MAHVKSQTSGEEADFLKLASGPSLRLGQLDLRSKLFPPHFWDEGRIENQYVDARESELEHDVELVWVPSGLPADILSRLISEIEFKLFG